MRLNYKREKLEQNFSQTLEEENRLINRNRLQLEEKLGEGNFGIIYKALLNDPNDGNILEVAVKTVKNGKIKLFNNFNLHFSNYL